MDKLRDTVLFGIGGLYSYFLFNNLYRSFVPPNKPLPDDDIPKEVEDIVVKDFYSGTDTCVKSYFKVGKELKFLLVVPAQKPVKLFKKDSFMVVIDLTKELHCMTSLEKRLQNNQKNYQSSIQAIIILNRLKDLTNDSKRVILSQIVALN